MPVPRVVLRNLRDQLFRLRLAPGPRRTSVLATLVAVAIGAAGLTATALARHHDTTGRLAATVTKLTLTVSPHVASRGAALAVSPSGIATTIAAIAGEAPAAASPRAAFTPATAAYLASASTSTAAGAAGIAGGTGGPIPITFTVPPGGAGSGGTGSGGTGPPGSTGDFAVTVRPGTVTLQNVGQSGVAIGMLQSVTVSETRSWAPGWSVRGQESDFIGKRGGRPRIIPGTYLGWIPTGTPATGAALGQAVQPGNPGIGDTGPVLAAADPGSGVGTSTLGAFLTLAIPASAGIGPYAGLLTITYVESTLLPASSGPGRLP